MAKQKRDEEKELLQHFCNLQEKLRSNFNRIPLTKAEMDRVKNKFKNNYRTQGALLRSKPRWYEFGEKKNSKYFYNLEKRNHKKKTHNFPNKKKPTFIKKKFTVSNKLTQRAKHSLLSLNLKDLLF